VTDQYSCATEAFDLALALDDHAQRDRLDAARRLGAGQLAPQHRREREADQIIERAAGAIGVDQIGIELARMPSSPRGPHPW
jgi:D-lyxose ketol-isomerase